MSRTAHILQLPGLLALLLLASWPGWAAARRAGGSPEEFATKLAWDKYIEPIAISAQECPGVVGSNCTRECQLRTCRALVDFYCVSNNASDPWDHEHGWELTNSRSCEQLTARLDADGLPVYCSWHGVVCCTPQHADEEHCSLLGSVSGLNLAINNLNVSLENPVLFRSLKTLHSCGLFMLDLEGNNVAGSLSQDWGQLRRLQYLNIGTCWVSGTIPRSISKMSNLTFLSFGNNWLNGSMPAWLPDLPLLRVVNLGSQFGGNRDTDLLGLLGTIPSRIGDLHSLRELVLEANSLTGTLPQSLCHSGGESLLVFNMRGNQLRGSAREVERCRSLVQLDISHNHFSGSLPASPKWEQLATYTASHNSFTGSWPKALSEARILEYLDLGHNQLTGLIPPKVTLMSSLKSVKLTNNMFSGTVVEDLYYMPAIAVLDLSNNQFVGTTPAAIGLSYGLVELDLSNNSGITGMLPPQLGLLPQLQVVKMLQTNMSCAGIILPFTVTTNVSCTDPAICTTPQQFGDPSAPITVCASDQLLPCFLRFSDYLVPREDNSNMKCREIVRKPAVQARKDCGGEGPQQLGKQATTVPDKPTDRWTARWEIDPSYYQYQVCECLLGFNGVWDRTGTVLTCVEEKKGTRHTSIIIACAVAAAAVLAVALIVWRQYLRTRPRWLRERLLQAKRFKGAPKAPKPGDKVLVTILVTDVKDFSDLTRRYPELMNKAMGGHNNIMRKACHAHAGHIMDQEGDSWTIAFHDAEDAVAFGLQVQQALGEKVWGLKLGGPASSDHTTTRGHVGSYVGSAQASKPSATSSYGLMGSGGGAGTPPPSGTGTPPLMQPGAYRGSLRGEGAGQVGGLARGYGSFSAASDDRGSSVPGQRSQDCSFTSAPGQGALLAPGDVEAGLAGPRHAAAAADAHQQFASSRQAPHGADTWACRDSSHQQLPALATKSLQPPGSSAGRPPPAGLGFLKSLSGQSSSGLPLGEPDSHTSLQSGSNTTGNSSRATSRLYSAGSALMHRLSRVVRSNLHGGLLPPVSSEAGSVQQLRLSVRIGIATGWLQHGRSLESCSVTTRAKNYVSEVANGGQVLLDEHTFRLIKHSLSALGTVDENGFNDKQLQQMMHARVVAKMQRVACGTACCSRDTRGDSFNSSGPDELSRDYDTDAIVVHMGGFTAPADARGMLGRQAAGTSGDSSNSPSAEDEDECEEPPPPGAASAAAGAELKSGAAARRANRRAAASGQRRQQLLHLQLYSIAAPKMRRLPQHTSELRACTSWCQPVRVKPGWQQVQKDYFQAPGARHADLAPSGQDIASCRPPLPAVTFVFAEVAGAHSFTHKHHRTELHSLNKAIRRCMLQLMADLPGSDGYMCRCHEPDLKYMVAFESPVTAVQWCLLVQEALMYMEWPEYIMSLPGFEEVTDPQTGQLLFRGPRLRMGVAEGIPGSVLPDHMGHANYAGGAVNRAARFMDVAAQPGQVVCDTRFAQRCFEAWAHSWASPGGQQHPGRQSWGSGLDCISPESIPESAAAGEWGDPQISLMQLMALRSQSETSGHCRPATGPQGPRSRALHELWYQQQQLKQGQKELLHHRQARPQEQGPPQPYGVLGGAGPGGREDGAGSSSGWHDPVGYTTRSGSGGLSGGKGGREGPVSGSGGLSGGKGGREGPVSGSGGLIGGKGGREGPVSGSGASFTRLGVAASGPSFNRYNPLTLAGGVLGPSAGFVAGPGASRQQHAHLGELMEGVDSVLEAVTASHIGSFSFKGSGVFEMVQLQHVVLLGRQFPQEAVKGKGVRLTLGSGPMQGLPAVQLLIPPRVVAARRAVRVRSGASAGGVSDSAAV